MQATNVAPVQHVVTKTVLVLVYCLYSSSVHYNQTVSCVYAGVSTDGVYTIILMDTLVLFRFSVRWKKIDEDGR